MSGESEVVAGYRLERTLGHGTMGTVYLARPLRGVDRQVAIKRVRVLGTPEERDRLRREAETLARLDHPNIVRILEVIDDRDGIAIVMSYAPNGTLASRIAASPLTPEAVTAVLAPIADALASAHRKGILHRDLKPQNVLFTSDDLPLLADFGISHDAAHTSITNTDFALGTAGYLDPDVADGAEPSEASDQYALGVVAYEALTGRLPFAAPTPLAVLRAADLGTHDVLRTADFGPLAEVVERAMHRRRADRFRDMDQLASALRDPASFPSTTTSTSASAPSATSTSAPSATAVDGDDGDSVGAQSTSADDRGTRSFRRRLSTTIATGASPLVAPSRRRGWIAATVVALMIAGGAMIVASNSKDTGLRSLRVRALPTCDPQTTAQCVRSYRQTGVGVDVTFDGGVTADYRAGEPGDVLRIANWFCGSRATLALYRPSTGVVYYLSAWPDTPNDGTSEPQVAIVADRTGVLDAQVGVGDHDGNGCADLALDRDRTRTWFLPSEQSGRLQKVMATS